MPADLDPDTIGPVDVAVILFEGNEFNGDVAPALSDLNDSGTVRIIDLVFVRKDDDESVSYAEVADAEVAEAFERLHDAQFDLLSDEDLKGIAGGLKAGSSALVIVWENTWARAFRDGGPRLPRPVDQPGPDPPRDRAAGHRST